MHFTVENKRAIRIKYQNNLKYNINFRVISFKIWNTTIYSAFSLKIYDLFYNFTQGYSFLKPCAELLLSVSYNTSREYNIVQVSGTYIRTSLRSLTQI